MFYEAGGVHAQHQAQVSEGNSVSLRGWGLSLAGQVQKFQLRGTLAWRDGRAPDSAPDKRSQAWFIVETQF